MAVSWFPYCRRVWFSTRKITVEEGEQGGVGRCTNKVWMAFCKRGMLSSRAYSGSHWFFCMLCLACETLQRLHVKLGKQVHISFPQNHCFHLPLLRNVSDSVNNWIVLFVILCCCSSEVPWFWWITFCLCPLNIFLVLLHFCIVLCPGTILQLVALAWSISCISQVTGGFIYLCSPSAESRHFLIWCSLGFLLSVCVPADLEMLWFFVTFSSPAQESITVHVAQRIGVKEVSKSSVLVAASRRARALCGCRAVTVWLKRCISCQDLNCSCPLPLVGG